MILKNKVIAIVSGGFDPLHTGHLDMFEEAALHGRVIALVNSDAWLTRKKGKPFMDCPSRIRIVNALKSVELALSFDDDENGSCCNGLQQALIMFPHSRLIFCNGGDRTKSNTPEQEFCEKNGIEMLWGIGGGKTQSSSDLLKSFGDASQ